MKLDKKGAAFVAGYEARENKRPRASNPYKKDELRAAWTRGWKKARENEATKQS